MRSLTRFHGLHRLTITLAGSMWRRTCAPTSNEKNAAVNSILGPGRPVFETQVEFEVSSEKGSAKHYGRRGLKRFLSRKRNDRNALGSNEQCHLLVNRGRLGRVRGMDEPNTWHFEQ